MNKRITRLRLSKNPFLMVVSVLLISGCASSPNRAFTEKNDERIATDLISTLIQIPEYRPFSTTLQMQEPQETLGKSIFNAVSSSGYGVQLVDSERGDNYVRYSIDKATRNGVTISRYNVSVNELSITREFTRKEHLLFPSGETIIQGVMPSVISVNDDLYRQDGGTTVFVSGVRFVDNNNTTLHLESNKVNLDESQKPSTGEQITKPRFLTLAKSRIFTNDRITSDWTSSENLYAPIKEAIIVFDENNLHMGNANKHALSILTDEYVADKSVFELFACNHGKSLSYDGTESLALERSMRTKEELLTLGVKLSDIKDNGCFISQLQKDIPQSGVIIILNTRI